MKIVVSDFDDTLFKRNFGLLQENIDKVLAHNVPVVILTHRATNQIEFIRDTLQGIELEAIYCTGDRKQSPRSKLLLLRDIKMRYEVIAHYDDDVRLSNAMWV